MTILRLRLLFMNYWKHTTVVLMRGLKPQSEDMLMRRYGMLSLSLASVLTFRIPISNITQVITILVD